MPCPLKLKDNTVITYEHTLKGCVHWFDLSNNSNPTISSQKARPFIIINNASHSSLRIIISPVTDRIHTVEKGTNTLKYPYDAPLFIKDYPFLDKNSVVLLDQVYTVGKDELCEEWYMGQVFDCTEIDKAILYNYDLFETVHKIYQELLGELGHKVKIDYMNNYSRK